MKTKQACGLVLVGLIAAAILVGGLSILLVSKTEKSVLSVFENNETKNLTYTISNCKKSEPENEIVKAYDDKIIFDIDLVTTNCFDYKVQMKKEKNAIKLLLQGEDCVWSVRCYNIKGEIKSLEKGKYILELHGQGINEIIRETIILK